jgi:hypothetical protein
MKPGRKHKGGKSKKGTKHKVSAQYTILIVAGFVLLYISFVSHIKLYWTRTRNDVDSAAAVLPARRDPTTTTNNLNGKPPLSDYIQSWNITKDVNWLLSFSIVAFPKCGTSSLMLYLKNQSDSIYMFDDERCELGWNQQVRLLKDLYQNYRPGLHMGIKCPRDLEVDLAMTNYRMFFSQTKFVVGLRHPVLWFESFYNHRIQNEYPMPPPNRLIGKCKRSHQGVCTDRADFARHLKKIEPTRPVFIYEVSQLYDDRDENDGKDPQHSPTISSARDERADKFRKDLHAFLQLDIPLRGKIAHVKPGRRAMSTEHEQQLASKKINICDAEHTDVRKRLQRQASESATWIQTAFLANSNVRVSSPEYFIQLLSSWHEDPCQTRDAHKTAPAAVL